MRQAVSFADDQATRADMEEVLQVVMDNSNRPVNLYGMHMNVKKTKVIKIAKTKQVDVKNLVR